jgi:predicted aldo/keto reductase-like oxidoreductase
MRGREEKKLKCTRIKVLCNGFIPEGERTSACVACQECEEKCPQGIPISDWMPIVHQVLGEGTSYDECPLP